MAAETILDEIAALVSDEVNYTVKLVSATATSVNVQDAINKLNDYAKASSGNLESFPRFFDSIYQAILTMRTIGKGCPNAQYEYDNIAYMSFNMIEDACASGSVNMQEAVNYLQQFIH